MAWQVQEASQHFDEVIQRALEHGPQTVSDHGDEVVVVVSAVEYRRWGSGRPSFKEYLRSMPEISDEYLERPRELPREVDI